MTRRQFFGLGAAAGAAALVAPRRLPARPASAPTPGASMSNVLTRSDFTSHRDTAFALSAADPPMDLTLHAVNDLPAADAAAGHEHQFALVFRGPAEPVLRQQTVELQHPTLGPIALFLVPVRQTETHTHYEAVFNRDPDRDE